MKKPYWILICTAASLTAALGVAGLLRVSADQATSGPRQQQSLSGLSLEEKEALAVGKRAYMTYCSGCHGEKGDGKGPAAAVMQPKPRDFTSGAFKFTSVDTGELPTDHDLFETITRGLRGTAMPSWRLLPEETRFALVEYIKTLSTAFEEPQGKPLAIPNDPFSDADEETLAAILARGEYLYHVKTQCWSCHVSYVDQARLDTINDTGKNIPMRENAETAVWKEDDWGGQTLPPDFTKDHLRSVYNMTDLAKRISLGVQGTAMAGWKDQLNTPEDLWAVVYYVDTKIQQRQQQILAKRGVPHPSIHMEGRH